MQVYEAQSRSTDSVNIFIFHLFFLHDCRYRHRCRCLFGSLAVSHSFSDRKIGIAIEIARSKLQNVVGTICSLQFYINCMRYRAAGTLFSPATYYGYCAQRLRIMFVAQIIIILIYEFVFAQHSVECIKYRLRAYIIRPPINSMCAIEMILSWRKK